MGVHVRIGETYPRAGELHQGQRFTWTGEFRAPKKGEWYLSGAIVEAYQATSDMTTPFHIAKQVA